MTDPAGAIADAEPRRKSGLGRSPLRDPNRDTPAAHTIFSALAEHGEGTKPQRKRERPSPPAFVEPPAVEYVEPPMDPEPEPIPEPAEVAAPAVSEVVAREAEAPKSLADIRAKLAQMTGPLR